MKIGIVTAMPEETGALKCCATSVSKRKFGRLPGYEFSFVNHEVVVIEAGMGSRNASAATEILIREVAPDLVISAGFCGGLDHTLQVGDTVVATGFMVISGTELESVAASVAAVCDKYVREEYAADKRVFAGLFVCSSTIIPKHKIAGMLPVNTPFPVVEMESAAIATVARQHNLPCLALRCVSDRLDEELAFTLDELCDAEMRISIPKVLLTIVKRPRIIPQLIRLAGNSRTAAAALTQSIKKLLTVLE